MPLTNFPKGLSSFGLPIIGSGSILTTGKIVFVNSAHGNASDGNIGESPDKPLSTIAAALLKTTANNFDHIIVGPGHLETITTADQLVLNVTGVTLVGLGMGSNRPTINFTTSVGADMNITGSNVALSNFLFTGGVDALSSVIDITGDDVFLSNIEWRDVTGQVSIFLNVAGGADRCRVERFTHRGDPAVGSVSSILLSGCAHFFLQDFWIDGNFSTGAINVGSTLATNVDISEGYIRNRNASDICIIDTITGSTGKIGPNLILSLADNAANITEAITGATFRQFADILVVNLDGEQAMPINTVASTDI